MQIYEKRYPRPTTSKDPTVAITKWSYASGVDILVAEGAVTMLIKVSPELATKIGWALLEAAVAKFVVEDAP
jgi:hypothetical protein